MFGRSGSNDLKAGLPLRPGYRKAISLKGVARGGSLGDKSLLTLAPKSAKENDSLAFI